ncbi:transporter [soil metagenome]
MTLRVAWLLARAGTGSRAATVLPIVAFAVVTALLLVVAGGAQAFWSWKDQTAGVYQVLSAIALALLVVPLLALGGSAARLSARRRDDRLSTLRLLGATPATVARLTVLESTALALAGAVVGVIGYFALVPAVALIPFRAEALGIPALILAPWAIAAAVAGIAVVAAVSALIGLRQVVISPLGVRTRQNAPRLRWVRVVVGAAVIALALLLTNIVKIDVGITVIAIVLGCLFGGTLAVLNLVGPFVLRLMARRQVRRARTAAQLLAGRTVLESPKAAWRQVSGVAMTSFMAVFAGTGVAVLNAVSGSEGATASDRALVTDIGTGLTITLVISFLMVACSAGVNQAADVFDRGDLYVNLGYLGMPRRIMDAARERAVMWPLIVVAVGSAAIAALVVLPLAGYSLIVAPLSLLTIALSIAAGIGLVWAAMRLTRPVLTARLAAAA